MGYRINHYISSDKGIPLVDECYISSGDDNIFTVLIGKNGSGKSRLLSSITNALCSIYAENKYIKRDIGTIGHYNKGDNRFSFKIKYNGISNNVKINERLIDCSRFIHDVCPSRLIAVSTSPFDKFPDEISYFSKDKQSKSGFYNYFGVSNSLKNKSLFSLIEKLLFLVLENTESNEIAVVSKVLNFLGFEPRFDIHFRTRHSIGKFSEKLDELTEADFLDFISTAIKKDIKYSDKYKKTSYTLLVDAFKELVNYQPKYKSGRELIFGLDFNDISSIKVHRNFFSKIKILVELNILTLSDVVVYPKNISSYNDYSVFYDLDNSGMSINDASSGQKCIMLNVLGIAVSIRNNSLVLIDEPEVSLHPEWQETYINLLIDSFDDFHGCHFIIATHSPQIISNLNKKNCFISLMDEGDVVSAIGKVNKSADFQLATIFNSPGSENEYLKRLAVNVLTEFSTGNYSGNDYSDIINLLISSKNKLDDTDPVKKLITLIEKVVSKENGHESN
ncbi:ATP-binding protein [Pectobacterium polaris]|uniref:AAA family ATPase n=1 Tax=Pectobacterium polaris TaxID=2042057 RepID=UPI001CC342F8|nr:AAA family ATPase [Pectobacterium polaris]UAY91693.1 ATP-binding protein [Pectobacterium polaris]